MLRNALSLGRLLASREWHGIGSVESVVGLCHDGGYDWARLDDMCAHVPGLSVRKTFWRACSADAVRNMFHDLPPVTAPVSEFILPSDRAYNFLDCDAWVLFSVSSEGCLAPARPYAVYCADLIQRYVPEIFDHADGTEWQEAWTAQLYTFLGWRGARCVFATTPRTRSDVIEYAGVAAERALLVPTLTDPPIDAADISDALQETPQIVWVTNLSPHKNHSMAVACLRIYYTALGGTLPLVVIGPDTNLLDPKSGAGKAATRAFANAPEVLQRTRFAGAVSDAAYRRLIAQAAVVWHNVIIDNGSFVAFDVARAGRQFVSSDYPQMRYLCERYGVVPIWHPANDPEAGAQALALAERRFMASERPLHAFAPDSEEDRVAGYGRLLQKLLVDQNG